MTEQNGTYTAKHADGYVNVGGGLKGARTDEELAKAILHRTNDVVLVKYGTSWCLQCKALLPKFIDLTGKFQNVDYVVASVDTMQKAVKGIRYSPHFNIYRSGHKVDEFHGADVQRLRDRMWLHNDRCAGRSRGQMGNTAPQRRGGLLGLLFKT